MLIHIVISCIRFYQKYLSPFKGTTCRFYPSCSHYYVQALQKHGLFMGSWLTALRVGKCHPFHPGGFDPVK